MVQKMDLGLTDNHIGGNFEWGREPCCDLLKGAVDEEQFVFVSNFVSGRDGPNSFYIMTLNADGRLARSDGLPIAHCPWCGTKINARNAIPHHKGEATPQRWVE